MGLSVVRHKGQTPMRKTRQSATSMTYVVDADFDRDDWHKIRDDHSTLYAKPACHIDAHIETTHHDLTGVVVEASLNNPTFRFEDGRHGFIIPKRSEDDTLHFLFACGYDDSRTPYKYEVTGLRFEVSPFETPTCPSCDTEMVYGMGDFSSPRSGEAQSGSGHQSHKHDDEQCQSFGWLCPEEYPYRIREGLY